MSVLPRFTLCPRGDSNLYTDARFALRTGATVRQLRERGDVACDGCPTIPAEDLPCVRVRDGSGVAPAAELDRGIASSEQLSVHTETVVAANQLVEGLWGVRYQVTDVPRAVDFYTKVLGFKLDF